MLAPPGAKSLALGIFPGSGANSGAVGGSTSEHHSSKQSIFMITIVAGRHRTATTSPPSPRQPTARHEPLGGCRRFTVAAKPFGLVKPGLHRCSGSTWAWHGPSAGLRHETSQCRAVTRQGWPTLRLNSLQTARSPASKTHATASRKPRPFWHGSAVNE